MMRPAKMLIQEIFAMERISVRKLAANINVKPSTVSRILTGKTGDPSLKTYMRLIEYKSRLMNNVKNSRGILQCTTR